MSSCLPYQQLKKVNPPGLFLAVKCAGSASVAAGHAEFTLLQAGRQAGLLISSPEEFINSVHLARSDFLICGSPPGI